MEYNTACMLQNTHTSLEAEAEKNLHVEAPLICLYISLVISRNHRDMHSAFVHFM